MRIFAHRLLTPSGMEENRIVTLRDGLIFSVEAGTKDEQADFSAEYLTPGLIDLHCHGGEGFNARDYGLNEIEPFLSKMRASGVTDFLLTISTGDRAHMRHGLEVTREAMRLQQSGKLGGARILGAHLDGPFLSMARPGAMQQSEILSPSTQKYEEMFSGFEDIIKKVTLAPEEQGADELIKHLLDNGVRVQAGHTHATFEQAERAFQLGVGSLCHSFNACRPINHRDPGVVVAALENKDVYMEAICDFVHLHPAIARLIYTMKGAGRMILISDSTLTHGLPNGQYHVEGYDIVVKDGVSRTASGALDGGGAYLDGAIRNLVSAGIPFAECAVMASRTPAERMGLDLLGDIAPGKKAHVVAWDKALKPCLTVMDDMIQ